MLAPIMKELGPGFALAYTTGLRGREGCARTTNMFPVGRVSENELVVLFQSCDALLFPSRLEGFGLVPLEAMSCGKPVIASDCCALRELVLHRKTGLLCQTNNVSAFVSACRELAANPRLTRRYGREARRWAVDRFSEKVIVPKYISLYQEVLGLR